MINALYSFNITDFYVLSISIIFTYLLFFAGRSITGKNETQAIQIPIGIILIYFFFLIGSIIKSQFSIINVLFFLIILSVIGIWRARDVLFKDITILSFSLIFIAPLLIFGALSHNYLWDDYTNWWSPARYLFDNHHLPTLDLPIINNANKNYPYLRALIHSLINIPINDFNKNIQIIFNILYGSTVLLWAAPLAKIVYPKNFTHNSNLISLMGSMLCFLIIIWIVILYKLLFSSYSEAVYLISISHIIFYLIIKIKFKEFKNRKFSLVLALLLVIPSTIKDIGFYHSIILLISYLLVFDCPNIIKSKENLYFKIKFIVFHFTNLIPLVITKFLWSYYVTKNKIHGGISFSDLNINEEKLNLIPKMLHSALQQLISNTAFTSSILIIILILLFSKRTKSYVIVSNYSLFLFAILSSLGIIILTLIAYVLIFTDYEAIRAASFNRYIGPASFILWVSIIISILNYSHNLNQKIMNISSIVIIFIYLIIILTNLNRYNFDENIDNKYIKIATDIINSHPRNEELLIIDLQTNGIDSVKIKYYINQFMPVAYVASVHLNKELDQKIIGEWFSEYKNIYIHSASVEQLVKIREFVNNYKE